MLADGIGAAPESELQNDNCCHGGQMAFRFETHESAAAGFHRLALQQISRARRHLTQDEDHGVAIHQARKCLKRLRALLRLARPALGNQRYRHENERFRDIARALSTSRDRQVMRDTVAKLLTEAGPREQQALNSVAALLANGKGEGAAPADVAALVEKAAEALREAKKDFKHLDLDIDMKDLICSGLKRCYRKGRKALEDAQDNPEDEAVHEWRKSVQVHWRHMLLLSEAWPEYFAVRANLAKELSDLLGEDHDLSVLAAFVTTGDGAAIGPDNAEAVIALATASQQELRARAFARGAYLFADDPTELSHAIYRYWTIALSAPRAGANTQVDDAADRSPQKDQRHTSAAGDRDKPLSAA